MISRAARLHWGQGLPVRTHLVPGLDVAEATNVEAACVQLLRTAMDELSDTTREAMIVATGGYKLMIAYLNLAGLLCGAKVSKVLYVHEGARCLFHRPRLWLMPDLQLWNRYFPLFIQLDRPAPDGRALLAQDHHRLISRAGFDLNALHEPLEPFVETLEGQVRLSPLGDVLHRRSLAIRRAELTGLFRRSLFDQALLPWLNHVARGNCGVVVVDLHHFKAVNDEHGHAAGDRVLKDVAQRIRLVADQHDCRTLRWGGEEFVVCPESPRSRRPTWDSASGSQWPLNPSGSTRGLGST